MQSGPKQIGQSFSTTHTQETTSGNKPNERNKQNSIKRETSVTVDQLHNISAQEKMKRLAVSRDGHPEPAAPYTNSNTGDKNGTSSASHAAPILNIQDPFKAGMASQNLTTILSTASDDFNSKYELVKEIGKGGFSTVYQCRNRIDGGDFAVKVVDLRPLRLKERFNPKRLKREVDIMRRLKHPNIIEFVEVFEDTDYLMMVMEYCPGYELFDVILARKCFTEADAKPIFAQIAKALHYLHSLSILHRDVKPENVLIKSSPDPRTGQLVAKLLDFGLSKNAGGGSAAKTFVGTPCYVAPEVEYTSKGLGGTYSFPADCWSLGAVLYVMLVARFPEFEQDAMTGKIVVKLNPQLWGHISTEAKDLIRSLMNTNPNARLSAGSALMHPWLGEFRLTQQQLATVAAANYELGRQLQNEEKLVHARNEGMKGQEQQQQQRWDTAGAAADTNNHGSGGAIGSTGYQQQQQHQQTTQYEDGDDDVELTAGGDIVHHQAMVVRVPQRTTGAGGPGGLGEGNNFTGMGGALVSEQQLQNQLAPLLHLQRSIAACFQEVHATYQEMPEVAGQIRRGAALCRQQLVESAKMLRKVEQTASSVLGMFPDLELAVEEGEAELAAHFFSMVKTWVTELHALVAETQSTNKTSMAEIQHIVEQSALGLQNQQRERELERERQKQRKSKLSISRQMLDLVLRRIGHKMPTAPMIEDVDRSGGGGGKGGAGSENKSNGNSSNSMHTAEFKMLEDLQLDSETLLELFLSLFDGGGLGGSGGGGGHDPTGKGTTSAAAAAGAARGMGGGSDGFPASRGSSGEGAARPSSFGRVYSLDSDGNSIEASSPTFDTLMHQNSAAGTGAGAAGTGAGAAGTGAVMLSTPPPPTSSAGGMLLSNKSSGDCSAERRGYTVTSPDTIRELASATAGGADCGMQGSRPASGIAYHQESTDTGSASAVQSASENQTLSSSQTHSRSEKPSSAAAVASACADGGSSLPSAAASSTQHSAHPNAHRHDSYDSTISIDTDLPDLDTMQIETSGGPAGDMGGNSGANGNGNDRADEGGNGEMRISNPHPSPLTLKVANHGPLLLTNAPALDQRSGAAYNEGSNVGSGSGGGSGGNSPMSPAAAGVTKQLTEALRKLQEVDIILEQLGGFWANTEVVLDLLTKKGQHVEQFIGFASKPKLMARFHERMDEYKRFWEGVRDMCSSYIAGVLHSTNGSPGFAAAGLDDEAAQFASYRSASGSNGSSNGRAARSDSVGFGVGVGMGSNKGSAGGLAANLSSGGSKPAFQQGPAQQAPLYAFLDGKGTAIHMGSG